MCSHFDWIIVPDGDYVVSFGAEGPSLHDKSLTLDREGVHVRYPVDSSTPRMEKKEIFTIFEFRVFTIKKLSSWDDPGERLGTKPAYL